MAVRGAIRLSHPQREVPLRAPIGSGEPTTPLAQDATPAQRLASYVERVRRRWLLVLVIPTIVASAAFVVSAAQQKQYEAAATLWFPQIQPLSVALGTNAPQPADPERESNTDVALVKLAPVAADVRAELNLRQSPSELLRHVSASTNGTSSLVSIAAREPDPRQAAALANAVADQYVRFRRSVADAEIAQAIRVVSEQLASLSAAERTSASGADLRDRLRQLQVARAAQTGSVRVVQRAEPPRAAISPRPARSAALGFFLGFLFSVAVALAPGTLDRRLKKDDEIAAAFDAPILGAIPGDADAVVHDGTTVREQYQQIALGLRLSGLERGAVLVGGTIHDTEQAAISVGVAQALAEAGSRVAVVEHDVRNPTLAGFLGVPGSDLAAVLAQPDSIVNEWIELATGRDDQGSIFVLPAGSTPASSSAVLSAAAVRVLLLVAASYVDIVLVPVGSLEETPALAAGAAGAVVIARSKRTTKAGAARVVHALAAAGIRTYGVVVAQSSSTRRIATRVPRLRRKTQRTAWT